MTEVSILSESKEVSRIRTRSSILRVGFWAGLVAFVGSVGYVTSAFLQVSNAVSALQDPLSCADLPELMQLSRPRLPKEMIPSFGPKPNHA